MIYFRTSRDPHRARLISVRAARLASSIALSCYPPGALLLGFGAHDLVLKLAGIGLLLVSLFSACVLVNTSVQRIVGEQPQYLDEFELQLRLRGVQSAYAAFTLLALLVIIYGAIASGTRLWVPHSYDGYDGLFWGAFLYAWMLPAFFVAWRMEPTEDEQR